MLKTRILAVIAALVFTLSGTAASSTLPQIFTGSEVVSAESATYVTVKFNATGGSCATSSKTVAYGNTYGTLPTPKKSGYYFSGWYDLSGNKCTEKTICQRKNTHTLYARWQKITTCTLKFNASGGNVTKKSMSYTTGNKLGALPVARKDGYTFRGWYTRKSGGTRVTADTVLQNVQDRIFYAQYSVPTLATLKYSFDNSYEGFEYDYDYIIPLSIYEYMFDVDEAFWLWFMYGQSWGGNCFGMSATSAFFNTGKVKVQSFSRNEYFIKELELDDSCTSLGLTVSEFIECMQVVQLSDNTQQIFYKNFDNYSGLVSQAKNCQAGKGKPAVVGISTSEGGHAVLAYKWKKVNSTTERVYVYDSNYPNDTNYITLKKKNGVYTGFTYDLGEYYDEANSVYGDTLTYVNFSAAWKEWTNRENTSKYSRTMLSVSADNAKIYSSDGILCARITDGKFESLSDDLQQAVLFGFTGENLLIYAADDEYTLVSDGEVPLTASLYANGRACTVNSDAKKITLSAAEKPGAKISARSGDSYSVSIYNKGIEHSEEGSAEADGELTLE